MKNPTFARLLVVFLACIFAHPASARKDLDHGTVTKAAASIAPVFIGRVSKSIETAR